MACKGWEGTWKGQTTAAIGTCNRREHYHYRTGTQRDRRRLLLLEPHDGLSEERSSYRSCSSRGMQP